MTEDLKQADNPAPQYGMNTAVQRLTSTDGSVVLTPPSGKGVVDLAASGAQGAQGAQGNQGAQGAQGNQGAQGAQGAQGTAGTAPSDQSLVETGLNSHTSLPNSTPTTITDYATLPTHQGGTAITLDPVTGIFTAEKGWYSYAFQFYISDADAAGMPVDVLFQFTGSELLANTNQYPIPAGDHNVWVSGVFRVDVASADFTLALQTEGIAGPYTLVTVALYFYQAVPA